MPKKTNASEERRSPGTVRAPGSSRKKGNRIVTARIPRGDRANFLRAIDLLPGLMAYAGYTDYDEFCRNFLLDTQDYLVTQRRKGNAPLQ